jgi:hypothetical protein
VCRDTSQNVGAAPKVSLIDDPASRFRVYQCSRPRNHRSAAMTKGIRRISGFIREFTYPVGLGTFDFYAYPAKAIVTRVEHTGNRILMTADAEIALKQQRDRRIVRVSPQARKSTSAASSAIGCPSLVCGQRSCGQRILPTIGGCCLFRLLEHDPEKWKPVFRKDHVQQRARAR